MTKRVLVISRRLVEGAAIAVNISVLPDEDGVPEIALSISVSDFIAALVSEIGNPAMILTQKQLAARLSAAADQAVENIKGESARVM